MNVFEIELTEREWKIYNEVMEKADETATFLAGLSHDDRLTWLREHQYSLPISFEREIGDTVYTVNAHFNNTASETVEEKTGRILTSI